MKSEHLYAAAARHGTWYLSTVLGICAAASPMQKHIHHDAAAASCLRDELRFGTWTVSQRGRAPGTGGECARFDYVNRTCDRGKAFSETNLCAALRCRSLYFVGDSTVRGMFLALAGELLNTNGKQTVLTKIDRSFGACSEEHLRLPRPICRSEPRCPRGVNVSYTRITWTSTNPSTTRTRHSLDNATKQRALATACKPCTGTTYSRRSRNCLSSPAAPTLRDT